MDKKEELKKNFYESLIHLIKDKKAQEDKEILDFYVEVCCNIAEDYAKKELERIFIFEKEMSEILDSEISIALALFKKIKKMQIKIFPESYTLKK
jgi:hypothetical protein